MYSDAEVFTFDPEGKIFLLLEIRQCLNDVLDNNVEARVEHDPIYNAVADNTVMPHEDDPPNDSWIGDVLQDNASQNGTDSVARGAQVEEPPPPLETIRVPRKTTTRHVKLRVSSRHLALASSIFGHMISSTQQEDQILSLEGDDFDALQILLNIVHGLHKKAPRTISRSMLYEVLKLVDKYEFDQVADWFTEIWFGSLESALPRGPSEHLVTWIYICHELKQTAHFERLTKIMILETKCDSPSAQEARILHVIGAMSTHIQVLLRDILSTLSRLIELYEGPDTVCHQSSDCDALALGKLIRGLRKVKLYPIPDPVAFTGSVHDLLSTLRALQLDYECRWENKKSRRHIDYWGNGDEVKSRRHLTEELRHSLSQIESRVQGLNLSEFLRS